MTPTLENYQKKVIDSSLCGSATNSACNSIKANLDGLQPRTYPYIRAYVITASGEVVYGNVITINAVDKPGIPSLPSSGNGGSSSSGETGSLPPTGDENSETYTLTYTAATGTYLLDYEVNTAWQEAAAIPENLNIGYGGNAEIVDNKLYIFGGDTCDDYDQWGNCDYQWLNKILIYDLEEDSWSDGGVIPAMNESGAVQWSRSVKVGDKIYFFGGCYVEIGEDALLVRIFDTINKTWSTSDLPNEDLYNAFPFYYNGDIYVLDMDWTFFNVYIYDPVDDEWVNASEPTVVEASTCGVDGFDFQGLVASINNNFYFFSGEDNDKFISYNVVDGSCESRDVAPLFRDSTFVFVALPTPYDNKLFTIVYKEEEPEPGEYDVNYFPVYYDLIAHHWQKLNSPYFYNDIKYEGNLDLPYLTTFDDKLIVVSGEVNTGEDDFISRQNSYLDLASFLFKKEYSVEVKQGESGPTIYAHPEAYFTGWSDGESANPRQDLNVQGDINVNSTFNLPELTLTYTMGLPIEPEFDHIQANLVIGEPSDWEVNEPLPYEGLANLISGVVDDKIYIFGGQLSPEQSTTTAYVYDTTLDSYEELSVTNPDNAFTYRASSSEISLGNKIYSIGGLNATGQRTASSSVFDTETNTWSAIASPTYATDNAPIEVYEGEIYLFNGLENVIEIYNPDTDTWRLSTTTPLDDFSGIYDVELVDGVFYLQGVSSSTPANGYFATFNPATDTWDMRHSGLSGGRSRQYNSFHNDQGIIMYLNMIGADGSLAEAMAVYDTTDCPGDGCWQDSDNQYSWSLFPKFSLADLEAFDFYVIGDYLYVIGGQDATGVINTNRKMPMSNFPVNTYTTTVFYGQAGPKIYFDYLELGWMDHEYNDRGFLNFSDNLMEQDINIGENFIQNINIQEDINVKLWISLQPC